MSHSGKRVLWPVGIIDGDRRDYSFAVSCYLYLFWRHNLLEDKDLFLSTLDNINFDFISSILFLFITHWNFEQNFW